jgi:hypothetical protein
MALSLAPSNIAADIAATALETLIYAGRYKDVQFLSDDKLNTPILSYINDKSKEFADKQNMCDIEHAKLEDQKTQLAKFARELQEALTAMNAAMTTLSAEKQSELKALLPSAISQGDLKDISTDLKVGTGDGTGTATNETVADAKLKDGIVPPSEGETSNEDVTATSVKASTTSSGGAKSC